MPAQGANEVVRLENIVKRFGDVVAVDGVSLDIRAGEFFSLLGPSGSGKTTLLRIIAGLEVPTSGRVFIDGVDVTRVPAWKRQVSLVFQDFGLFPHMTVLGNVEFPLKARGVPGPERRRRALEMLELVQLKGYENRFPHQLSGGQQQRVALARGLVARPKILLLDEPLANLDRKLRDAMEVELRRVQRELGIAFAYVTHNQEEALTLSDRMAVLHNGRLEQVSETLAVYERPATPFVAEFVGKSNTVEGYVIEQDGTYATVETQDGSHIRVPGRLHGVNTGEEPLAPGDRVKVFIKTERLRLAEDDPGTDNVLAALLEDRILRGAFVDYVLLVGEKSWIATESLGSGPRFRPGAALKVGWNIDQAHCFRVAGSAAEGIGTSRSSRGQKPSQGERRRDSEQAAG